MSNLQTRQEVMNIMFRLSPDQGTPSLALDPKTVRASINRLRDVIGDFPQETRQASDKDAPAPRVHPRPREFAD